jgi:hypothetical protein
MKTASSERSRWILATGLCSLFWCSAVLILAPAIGWTQHAQHGSQSSAAIGTLAVAFDLKSVDGNSVGLSFRGKPLMMNFFASWCDHCREEMPMIQRAGGESRQGRLRRTGHRR